MKKITFIDEARIKIKAGRGGDGGMFFHREKYVNEGGPSGGNGGDGGSIFFVADKNENTLLNFKGKTLYKAENGVNGFKQNMTGARGKDLLIKVPVGTEILIDGEPIFDLSFDGQMWLAAEGGKGGRGNASFKSSKNTAPTLFERGVDPDTIELILNLKVLADVGLLGYPNVGKSTFVSVISNSKPKIANYEFTTLTPNLGLVKHHDSKFVVTDLPGLIDGASQDKGMGIQFLKHLSRTKMILHFIDSSNLDWKERYQNLRKELEQYSKNLFELKEVIVLTKSDLIDLEIKKMISSEFKNKEIFFISSITKSGLEELLNKIVDMLEEIRKEQEKEEKKSEDEYIRITLEEDNKEEFNIKKEGNEWIIDGVYPRYWAKRIPLTSSENFYRLWNKLKSKKIIQELKNMGVKDGDVVIIPDTEFMIEYEE